MSRNPRISYPGAFFHIVSKSVDNTLLFQNNEEFELYLELLKKYTDLNNVKIHSYAMLNTHIHMIVETPLDNISSFMKSLNTSYATSINKKRDRKGHLFGGRFHSVIIDSNKYITVLSRYIHLNPVDASIVDKPEDYKWSSFKYFIGKENPPDFLITDLILSLFEYDRKRYYNFTIEGIKDKVDLPSITKLSGIECYGNLSFAKKTIQKFERRRKKLKKNKKRRWKEKNKQLKYDKVVSISLSNIKNAPSFEDLIYRKDNNSAFIKGILGYFLTKYSALSISDISQLLGYKNESAISMQIKKIYDTSKKDKVIRKLINEIEKKILKF